MIFQYGLKEIEYLKNQDQQLGKVIDQIGWIEREVDDDIFSTLVRQIIAQQISTKAQATIWQKLQDACQTIDAKTISACTVDDLRSFGISQRKADSILEFAQKVNDQQFDLEALWDMDDEQVILQLTSLKGVGVWTAQMILIFCMQRKNVLSNQDYGIRKGLCMIYHHQKIDRQLFEKYKRLFSPYCSIASFYLWAIANGQISYMNDDFFKK